ncbi:MurR/RpiR family transcriptional regulator [Clostridium sardiniense]|uniref:MurR/RpiR family transcriptional regulator n=1 Tax=Clostridium sardiniense TaxID=29369 RepID=UPI003D33AD83
MIIIDKLNNYINNHNSEDINYNIASFIVNNIESIPNYNITELSKLCFVSQATVSRFIKKLGYIDYNAFKEECSIYIEEVKNNIDNNYTDINLLSQDLKLLYSKINHIDINNIASVINSYDKVYISGLNYCYLMAQYFQMECHPFGKIVKVIEDNEEIQDIGSDSLLLILTTSGNYFNGNRIVKEYIRNCKGKKLVISIQNLDNKIKNLFNKYLILDMNIGVKNSRYVMMALLDNIIEALKNAR